MGGPANRFENKVSDPSGPAVPSSCEPPDAGAVNQTQVLWQSSAAPSSPAPDLLTFIFCVYALPVCMYVHHGHAWYLRKPERELGPLELKLQMA